MSLFLVASVFVFVVVVVCVCAFVCVFVLLLLWRMSLMVTMGVKEASRRCSAAFPRKAYGASTSRRASGMRFAQQMVFLQLCFDSWLPWMQFLASLFMVALPLLAFVIWEPRIETQC